MTGSHICSADTGAKNGQTTYNGHSTSTDPNTGTITTTRFTTGVSGGQSSALRRPARACPMEQGPVWARPRTARTGQERGPARTARTGSARTGSGLLISCQFNLETDQKLRRFSHLRRPKATACRVPPCPPARIPASPAQGRTSEREGHRAGGGMVHRAQTATPWASARRRTRGAT